MATAAESLLGAASAIYVRTWFLLGPSAVLFTAAMAALGGAIPGLAAAADVLLVVSWPMVLVYGCLTALYRLHLRCLKATWRLLRGKQKVECIQSYKVCIQQLIFLPLCRLAILTSLFVDRVGAAPL